MMERGDKAEGPQEDGEYIAWIMDAAIEAAMQRYEERRREDPMMRGLGELVVDQLVDLKTDLIDALTDDGESDEG